MSKQYGRREESLLDFYTRRMKFWYGWTRILVWFLIFLPVCWIVLELPSWLIISAWTVCAICCFGANYSRKVYAELMNKIIVDNMYDR